MLIVCSGPDTWRARKRAKELLEAFKTKHDISGFSTEILKPGDFQAVLNQIGAPSIFSPKRMIRCDGLLAGLKIADIRRLALRLKADGENTILLTVEDEPPTAKILDEFKGPGFFHYPYPELTGSEFHKICLELSIENGLDASLAKKISIRCNGDIWKAINEIGKFSANNNALFSESEADPDSTFNVVDAYLDKKKGWLCSMDSLDDDQLPSLIMTQAKAAIRIKNGEVVKLPPFVINKFQKMSLDLLEISYFNSLKVSVGTRNGLMGSKEVQTLF